MTNERCPICKRAALVTRGGSPISSVWFHSTDDERPHHTCDIHRAHLAPEGKCGGCDDVRWSMAS